MLFPEKYNKNNDKNINTLINDRNNNHKKTVVCQQNDSDSMFVMDDTLLHLMTYLNKEILGCKTVRNIEKRGWLYKMKNLE